LQINATIRICVGIVIGLRVLSITATSSMGELAMKSVTASYLWWRSWPVLLNDGDVEAPAQSPKQTKAVVLRISQKLKRHTTLED
jgi:hypothetical protein